MYVVGYEEGDLFQAICSLGTFPSEAYVPSWRSTAPSDSKSTNDTPTADEIQKEVTNVTNIIGNLSVTSVVSYRICSLYKPQPILHYLIV